MRIPTLNATRKYSTTDIRKKKKLISPPCPKPTRDLGRTNLSPLEPPMVVDRAVDAPRDATEPPKVCDDGESYRDKDDRLRTLGEAARGEDEVVEHVGGHEDAKVERRELAAWQGGTS